MKIALLSDPHGNLLALEAVLRDVAMQKPDAIACLGDYTYGGAEPRRTAERIRSLNAMCVRGNMDEAVADADNPDEIAQWVRRDVGDEHAKWMGDLPLTHRFLPPGGTSLYDDLLICHSTPTSCHPMLLLDHPPTTTTFADATPLPEAEKLIAGTRAGLIGYGHIHHFSRGVIGGQPLASIGSIGFPFDGDPRAAWALALWDGAQWKIDARRVDYDHEAAARAIEDSAQPHANISARRIRTSTYVPRT